MGGDASIFDDIAQDDLIMAFFPCVRFETRIMLNFRGDDGYGNKPGDTMLKIKGQEWCLLRSMQLQDELTKLYDLISYLVIIAIRRNLKLVIENPWQPQHYLVERWCVKPQVIDMDRTKNGDYFKKPTQYWFVGFQPKQNLVFEPMEYVQKKKVLEQNQVNRSMIHPQYANRFIRQYLIDQQEDAT